MAACVTQLKQQKSKKVILLSSTSPDSQCLLFDGRSFSFGCSFVSFCSLYRPIGIIISYFYLLIAMFFFMTDQGLLILAYICDYSKSVWLLVLTYVRNNSLRTRFISITQLMAACGSLFAADSESVVV